MPGEYRRGSPYNPGQYPVADYMLGMAADPANEVPIGKAAEAVVNPALLSAGGKRVFQALKNLSQKSPWAESMLNTLKSKGLPSSESADIIHSYASGAGGPEMRAALSDEITKTKLPELTLNKIEGGKSPVTIANRQAEIEGLRKQVLEKVRANPDATLVEDWAVDSPHVQEARYAEREFEKMRDWPTSPTVREGNMSPSTTKSFHQDLNNWGSVDRPMIAIPGGKSPQSPEQTQAINDLIETMARQKKGLLEGKGYGGEGP